MLNIGKEKKKRQCQLLILAAIAALALISGCADRSANGGAVFQSPGDGGEIVNPPGDGGAVVLDERHSVWRNLKIYSIYHYRLPDSIGSMTPYDMFSCINDTLHGRRYTEYMDDRPGGGVLFDPDTEFPEPKEFTPSTVYFYLPEFSDTALVVFNRILPKLSEYQNIIIDVRDNGGGYLSVTDAILGELLPYGTPYIKVRYRDYNKQEDAGETLEDVFSTETQSPKLLNKRVAVLMNGYSASASEMLAAGLKDGADAYLVGGNTYGKGIGQMIIPVLTSEKTKRLSVTFLEISGMSERTGQYHRVGIKPDPVPADIKSDVDAHIPNASQREIIQEEVEKILAEYPNASASYVRQLLTGELREMYYALKMLQPELTFTDEGGMGKRRDANIGEISTMIHRAREKARAKWRPMGAVIADEKGLRKQ
jgi:hypothetical protein